MVKALYPLCLLLFAVGLYAAVTKRNLVKIVLGVIIMDHAVNLFLILIGYRKGGLAPIVGSTQKIETFVKSSVDPLPQAMVLTSIVISLGLIALMVTLCLRLYDKYGTYDITKIRRLRG